MVQRWKMSPNQSMVTEPDGGYVEYDDHLAALEEKDKEIERLNRKLYRHGDYKYRTECNCQRCSGFAVDEYDKEDSDGLIPALKEEKNN